MAERMDQERRPDYNREPGVVVVPDSNFSRYMERFEQFPSKYGSSPGNPYRFRPFPKMLYQAREFKGKVCCMAAAPNPNEFSNPSDAQRAEELARQFTESCQRIVNDERELQAAMENGYRESPDEAVAYLLNRQKSASNAMAERHYEDRNMSEAAQAEAKEAERQHFDETGLPLESVPEKRRRGRRPRAQV